MVTEMGPIYFAVTNPLVALGLNTPIFFGPKDVYIPSLNTPSWYLGGVASIRGKMGEGIHQLHQSLHPRNRYRITNSHIQFNNRLLSRVFGGPCCPF